MDTQNHKQIDRQYILIRKEYQLDTHAVNQIIGERKKGRKEAEIKIQKYIRNPEKARYCLKEIEEIIKIDEENNNKRDNPHLYKDSSDTYSAPSPLPPDIQ